MPLSQKLRPSFSTVLDNYKTMTISASLSCRAILREMRNKGSGSSSQCTLDKDDDIFFRELRPFLDTIENSRLSGHGVSVNLVMSSVSFIDGFNRRTMELRHDGASRAIIKQDKFLSSVTQDFLDLSLEADDFLQTLLTSLKNLNKELRGLLEALLQWSPSQRREDKEEIRVLDKLWSFSWGESFSKKLLESFQGLLRQHQDIVKKVQQQGASLERKCSKLKRLKKAISAIFVSFVVVFSVCSVIAAALPAGPAFAAIVAAANSVASWRQLTSWVDELWVDKLKELHQGKELCTKVLPVEVINRGYVMRDLDPMYSFVNQLKEMLELHPSRQELLRMKESLQNELLQVIDSVGKSIKAVESSKGNIEGRMKNYLNGIQEGRAVQDK